MSGNNPTTGFVRYELYIMAALIIVAIAVVLPQLQHGEFLKALLTLLILGAMVATCIAALVLLVWLIQAASEPGLGWGGRIGRGLGFLLRIGLCALIAMLLASALVANHHGGARRENLATVAAGVLGASLGAWLHRHLGPTRFWNGFKVFFVALLGSLAGGILGILLPEPWGIDAGVALPLLVFLVLALTGRLGASVRKPREAP